MISPLSRSLRLAVYGAGIHSRGVLLPALASLEHGLEAVGDPRPGWADDLAQRYAFRATFCDFASLLRDTNVQAIIISRDAPNLPEIVEPLLRSSLPFWVDAATPGLDRLVERLRRRSSRPGPTYMICHPYRFAPAYVRAEELIRSGRLGDLTEGSLEINSAKSGAGQAELPLEYLLQGAFDLLGFLLGKPAKAYSDGDDSVSLGAILRFERFRILLQLRKEVSDGQAAHFLRLYGRDGQYISVKNAVDMSAWQGESLLVRSVQVPASGSDICTQQGWTAALAKFLAAAGSAEQVSSDMTDGLSTAKMAEQLSRGLGSGKEVQLRF